MMHNYFDMTRELKANRIAYDYWHDRIHERVGRKTAALGSTTKNDRRPKQLLTQRLRSKMNGKPNSSLQPNHLTHSAASG